ncbi:S-adenosyl-L-methionine-dependent methyltransferase [Russula emetica]|nr:S-adenosyl-L-methionine-dependent methyltransferase [Russula emetica]
MSDLPQPKPVVLISSLPPGSLSRKRKLKEDPSDSSISAPQIGQPDGQKKRGTVPSARIEVLLPPLGSWKRRLLGQVGSQRPISGQRAASTSSHARPPSSEARHVTARRKCLGTRLAAMSYEGKGDKFYTVADDESIENAGLLPGETESELDDSDAEIPVRLLDDFTIYDWDTLRLVPTADLLDLGPSTHYGASGLVRPWTDDGTDDDSDEDDFTSPLTIKLTPIIELNVHQFTPSTGSLDVKIYLKTRYAWYILNAPSKSYRPYFSGYWLKHQVLHLLVTSALANSAITLAKFLESPDIKGDTSAISQILKRPLSKDDILSKDMKAYIQEVLLDLSLDGLKLAHVPIIYQLFKADIYSQVSIRPLFKHSRNIGNSSHYTVVTPEVFALSMAFFLQCFKVVKPFSQAFFRSCSHSLNMGEIHGSFPIIKWIGSPVSSVYGAVKIGKTIYMPGEVVIVLPGEDPDKTRQKNAQALSSQSLNSLAEYWFIRICYLFERDGQQFLHGQWLAHGSKTLLQETAHSNGLFLMNSCDDVPLASIIQKCNLHWLAPNEMEHLEDTHNRFYCSNLIWDEDLAAFLESTQDPFNTELSHFCAICDSQAIKRKSETPILNLGSIFYLGMVYHKLDFIYVLNEQDEDAPYEIGQILNFSQDNANNTIQLQIRKLKHYDDFAVKHEHNLFNQANWKKDEHHLYYTSQTETISAENITGKCYTQCISAIGNLEAWKHQMNHFYIQDNFNIPLFMLESSDELQMLDSSTHSYCEECYKEHIKTLEKGDALFKQNRALRALEIFSGAGGLSIGLEESGFVKTRWAIEYAPSAAKTFQANKKHATVYNQDCNTLLEHAIEFYNGKNVPAVRSLDDKTPLPPLPKPGEVDLICGGPPCQGFSQANRHPQPDDPRNSLVCNMLSYVEFYRPKFFLLENVLGLLIHKLQVNKAGPQEGNVVAHGIIKFILRTLTSLGYQVRFSVLQAGVYGSPQNRRRVIFWGARRGLPLPEFPIPTHNFESKQWTVQLDTGLRLDHVTRDPDRPHRGAPLRTVTVDDVISDLPKFDWKNPHSVIEATRADKAEEKKRAAIGIPAFEAVSNHGAWDQSEGDPFPGYPDGVPYASPPRTRYQALVRQGSAEDAEVELHYTARYSEAVVERVCNVAIELGADWRSLPEELAIDRSSRKEGQQRDVRYSRIDGSAHFRTATTTVAPNAQGSTVIHPTQKRVLTVRECARAQGFPDSWKFLSVSEKPSTIVRDQLRQIGNAVPVPLSRALGNALGDTLIKMWEAEAETETEADQESGSPDF